MRTALGTNPLLCAIAQLSLPRTQPPPPSPTYQTSANENLSFTCSPSPLFPLSESSWNAMWRQGVWSKHSDFLPRYLAFLGYWDYRKSVMNSFLKDWVAWHFKKVNGIECYGEKRERKARFFSRWLQCLESEYLQDIGENQKRENEQVSEVFAGYSPEIKKHVLHHGTRVSWSKQRIRRIQRIRRSCLHEQKLQDS